MHFIIFVNRWNGSTVNAGATGSVTIKSSCSLQSMHPAQAMNLLEMVPLQPMPSGLLIIIEPSFGLLMFTPFFLLFQWLYWGFTDAISFWNQSWKCFQSSLYRCRIQWNGHIPTNSQYLHLIDYVFNSNQVLFICTEARNSRTRHNRKLLFGYRLTRAFCLFGFFSFWCGPQTKDELFRSWITNGLSFYFYSLLLKIIICICFH